MTTPSVATDGHHFRYPGASPSVSWNGSKTNTVNDAIVWALDTGQFGRTTRAAGPAVLFGYRAVPVSPGTLGPTLWDTSAYDDTVPGNPGAVKFVSPTIVEGMIFVAGGAQKYQPGTANCPVPTTTAQPTACGGLTMYK
jgi:hypothetical protein